VDEGSRVRLLLTGGAGFIGSAIATAALDAGHEVTVLDALLPSVHAAGWPTHLDPRADRVLADVRQITDAQVSGYDAVVHQAAKVGLGVDLDDLPDYVSHNELGTAVLLAAMARTGVRRLVLASSMVVYGEGGYTCERHGSVRPGPREIGDLDAGRFEPRCPTCGAGLTLAVVTEDAPLDPRNAYAASKTAQEHLAASWARGCGGTAVALRYHNVYGPHMPQGTPYAGVASLFRSALERGEAPRVFEDGGQTRDFVHVRDVADANVLALSAGIAGALRTFNVASGIPHTVGQMATSLAEAFGGPEPVVTGEYRLGDVRHVVASPDRARDELGFTALTGFDAGMKEFATAPLREAVRA
jgi:dTDP-L-rhamnose 4-epimerase